MKTLYIKTLMEALEEIEVGTSQVVPEKIKFASLARCCRCLNIQGYHYMTSKINGNVIVTRLV